MFFLLQLYEEMIAEGETCENSPQYCGKIPMTKDGVKALKYFSDKGIKTNCTLIFSAGQALLAAKVVQLMFHHS